MQICQHHWDLLRQKIEEIGLTSFAAKNAEEATKEYQKRLLTHTISFDSLMFCNNMLWNMAFDCGGLRTLEGPCCPICDAEMRGEHRWIEFVVGACKDYYNRSIR